MKYEIFSLFFLVFCGVIGYLCMKLNVLRSASRKALWALLEDENCLRHGIMAGFTPEDWARNPFEAQRYELLRAIEQLLPELKQGQECARLEQYIKSLQVPENWKEAQYLAEHATKALRDMDMQ